MGTLGEALEPFTPKPGEEDGSLRELFFECPDEISDGMSDEYIGCNQRSKRSLRDLFDSIDSENSIDPASERELIRILEHNPEVSYQGDGVVSHFSGEEFNLSGENVRGFASMVQNFIFHQNYNFAKNNELKYINKEGGKYFVKVTNHGLLYIVNSSDVGENLGDGDIGTFIQENSLTRDLLNEVYERNKDDIDYALDAMNRLIENGSFFHFTEGG